ncbi:MAG: hypothetical protein JNM22_18475 [Saprospiraceae bacterium]|nr:hypothetical protein [Saprospiraceae bacterium]
MKNLADVKEQLAHFWEIESEAERDALLLRVRNYASQQDADNFAGEIRRTFEQIDFSGISVVYEALSNNPEKWGRFFVEEYQRAFQAAEKSVTPSNILKSLEEMSFASNHQAGCTRDVIRILSGYFSNPKDAIRYWAFWHCGNWLSPDNVRQFPETVAAFQHALQDSNWKIRHIVRLALTDMGQQPPKPSLLDRFRVWAFNPFSIQ